MMAIESRYVVRHQRPPDAVITAAAASSTLAARANHFVVFLDRSIDSRSGEGITMPQSSWCSIPRDAPRG